MLRIPNLEELQALLLKTPALVDDLETRDPETMTAIRDWLRAIETALANNRMPRAAEIAGLRAQLVMAGRGALDDGLTVSGTVTLRKVREATAAHVLRRAGSLLSDAIAADLARVDEADRVARQLATAAQFKGWIDTVPLIGERLVAVHALWSRVQHDPEIGQGAVHMISLLGPDDAVLAFDRAISRDVWR